MEKYTFKSDISELDSVSAVIRNALQNLKFSEETIIKTEIAAEELFVNICSYAYESRDGGVNLEIGGDTRRIKITFKDGGIPFDPLSLKEPDTSLSANERSLGGLGVFMAKRLVSEFNYERKDDLNVYTIVQNNELGE